MWSPEHIDYVAFKKVVYSLVEFTHYNIFPTSSSGKTAYMLDNKTTKS